VKPDRPLLTFLGGMLLIALAIIVPNYFSREDFAPVTPIASSSIAPALVSRYRVGSVSSRAAEWLYRCINADWDWKQFGGGPQDAPANPVARNSFTQAARKILLPYGAPVSMQLVDQRSYVSNDGHSRTAYRYRVTFARGYVMYIFALDEDGNAGGIMISTNTVSFEFWRQR
jgi:hypothetical protein